MSMINGVSDFYGSFSFDGLSSDAIKSMSFLYDQYRDVISVKELTQLQRKELIAWCVHNFQRMIDTVNSWDQENFFEMRITQMSERFYDDYGYYIYRDIRNDRTPFNEYLVSSVLDTLYKNQHELETPIYITHHPRNFAEIPVIGLTFKIILIMIFIIISGVLFYYV